MSVDSNSRFNKLCLWLKKEVQTEILALVKLEKIMKEPSNEAKMAKRNYLLFFRE